MSDDVNPRVRIVLLMTPSTSGTRKPSISETDLPVSPDDLRMLLLKSESPVPPRMEPRIPVPDSGDELLPNIPFKLFSMLSSVSSIAELSRRAPSGVDAALSNPPRIPGTAALRAAWVLSLFSPKTEDIRVVKSLVRCDLIKSTRLKESPNIVPPILRDDF